MGAIAEEQKSIRARLAQQTFNEVTGKLKLFKKCMLLRPTGFGKTYLLAHLTKRFKRVLYLYPIDVIRLDVKTKYKHLVGNNTKFLSYRGLINIYKSDKSKLLDIAKKYDLIICDEAHMVGASMTAVAVQELMRVGEDNYFVGATATPDRSDGYDVTANLFDDVVISEYTLHDAIEDGLIPKPNYVYSLYKAAGSMRELTTKIKKVSSGNKREALLNQLKAIEVEMGNLINAPKVLKQRSDKT